VKRQRRMRPLSFKRAFLYAFVAQICLAMLYLASLGLLPSEVSRVFGRVMLYIYSPAVFMVVRLLGIHEGDSWSALGLVLLLLPVAGILLAALYSLVIAAVAVAIARLRARPVDQARAGA
jgi:hypothetical protein